MRKKIEYKVVPVVSFQVIKTETTSDSDRTTFIASFDDLTLAKDIASHLSDTDNSVASCEGDGSPVSTVVAGLS